MLYIIILKSFDSTESRIFGVTLVLFLVKDFAEVPLPQKNNSYWCIRKQFHAGYTVFFIRKPFFCLSLSFLNIILEIRLWFSQCFLKTFISLFTLIVHLVRLNTNNKRYFLTYMLTLMQLHNLHKFCYQFYNKNRKNMLKFTQFCNL